MRVLLVAGARPNFVKVAPIARALEGRAEWSVIWTNQHYAHELSRDFIYELGIDRERVHRLPVRPRTPVQTFADITRCLGDVFSNANPDWVVVVGDVLSTLAAAVAARYCGVRVAHVEAGLRSWDHGMIEEWNRRAVDRLSDVLFCSEESGVDNLISERVGVPVVFVGNVMIDSLVTAIGKRDPERFAPDPYALLTLHRPSNVDFAPRLAEILDAVGEIARKVAVVFPAHPRTAEKLQQFRIAAPDNVSLCGPLGYQRMVAAMADASFILTDSGGVQEEATFLKVPCVTIRENTERPVTIACGGNTLAGVGRAGIIAACGRALEADRSTFTVPDGWDGRAAERIADHLLNHRRSGCGHL